MITQYSMEKSGEVVKGLHILLAEDNPVNQKLAVRLLEKRGHHVTVAGNGRQALTAMEKESYDLVLMDVQMPEMDGLEATILLRGKEKISGRHQAVVAMTALVMKGDRERCMEAGMDGYLTKPIRPQELDEVLDLYATKERVSVPEIVSKVPLEESVQRDELLERIDGDRTFLAELLEIFRGDYPRQISSARDAAAKGDGEALQRVGHALKGALGNLAATKASNIAGELESMGKSQDLSHVETTVIDLEKELVRVVKTLDGICLEAVK